MDLAELWSVFRLPAPALVHQVKEFFGDRGGRRRGRGPCCTAVGRQSNLGGPGSHGRRCRRSCGRRRQQVVSVSVEKVLEVLHHLVVRQFGEGQVLATAENLPQENTERPRVALAAPKTLKKRKKSFSWTNYSNIFEHKVCCGTFLSSFLQGHELSIVICGLIWVAIK